MVNKNIFVLALWGTALAENHLVSKTRIHLAGGTHHLDPHIFLPRTHVAPLYLHGRSLLCSLSNSSKSLSRTLFLDISPTEKKKMKIR